MKASVQREVWVDNVKAVACILVVLGHFFQSMTRANILPANDLYQWFNQTIYYFHVPLFFICSGYLYQKLSVVNDVRSWSRNVLKKLLVLGVPYFVFSFITWILKTLFSSSVNSEIGGLGDTLFLHPVSPYWYLYALFLLFLITPTFSNRTLAVIGLAVALVFKILGIMGEMYEGQALLYILSNEIWFVIGMCLSVFNFDQYLARKSLALPVIFGIIFLLLSVICYIGGIQHGAISFLLGLLACGSVTMAMGKNCENGWRPVVLEILANYIMPIFLMHTLFAASLRILLLKMGIQDAAIHVALGIPLSFIGPTIAAIIMKRGKWLEFFVYPGKFIKL